MKQGKRRATHYIAAAVGLAVLSGSAMAGIVGSVHDFSSATFTGGAGFTPGGIGDGEICVTCHTPHNNTSGETLLWNHDLSAAAYTPYGAGSGSLNATVGDPTGVSKLCLSCHDGTVAIDSFGGALPGGDGNKNISDLIPGTAANIGGASLGGATADLSNDHPISFTYDAALVTADGALHATGDSVTIGDNTIPGAKQKTGTIATAMLVNDQVQCSSCHDVHNNYITNSGKLLKISMDGSGLCLTCHDK